MPALRTIAAAAALAASLAGCGAGPDSRTTQTAADFKPAGLAGADARLQRIYAQANELLPGGRAAYRKRVAELRGLPIVVNKWASWCGPCAAEFPYFQRQARKRGAEVAFLGANTNDARGEAETFLADLPVPFPSYADERAEIAADLKNVVAFPATAFYDNAGRLTYVHQGQFSNEAELEQAIERYSLGGAAPR